jgi:Tfp pilus tip-associated adhesin PilY1
VASTFTAVSGGGVTRRVPIIVVAIKPAAADEASLQLIATNSGGAYFNVSDSYGVARAVSYAVQLGFGRSTDFATGTVSEYQSVSPIVGTVNMKNASAFDGSALPNTDIVAIPGGQALPQRSNVIVTAGFGLPGFDGKIRAFRTYRPEPDATKPTGWKFVNDGTKLWPDLDGDRPELAGLARAPKDPNVRNIYTFIPDGSGGGSVVAFNLANAATLQPHLGGAPPATLIPFVRSLPIGAVIGSTPALMDPPSLDPPPDDDYGRTDAVGTFAGDHKDRRGIIFFGANDGMIHAVDARTGFEVWAFIPYNLLPKLRTLYDGQPVGTFDYFVDSSPKIAEVKLNGNWRSMLIIGQGPGGTFYQAFDVTEAGMGVAPDQGDIGAVTALLQQFDLPDESISFKWAFPNYSSFDPTYTATFTVSDGTAGGQVRLYGDLKASATSAEKSVGFTWSDPAVGPLDPARTTNVVIAGSGYFPALEDSIPGRGVSAPRAGQTLYLIDLATGTLLGNPTGGACLGTGCLDVGDIGNGRKNSLQADPTAAGDVGSPTVKKAYLGDLDGKYWRFDFTAGGGITKTEMVDTAQPIYASSALLFVGSTDVYMFFSTGSDILPPTAGGGTGTFKLWGLKDNFPGAGATTKFTKNLATVSTSGGLVTGERPSTAPSVAGDIVFYTTTVEDAGAPCSDFSAKLYGLTFIGGAAYDTDNSGSISNNESPVVRTVAGRATAPFIVDQHLYFGASGAAGSHLEAFGDPEDFNNGVGQVGVRILSWREIR